MIVKKIIEKLRNRGYDDFYLADLAEKHEGILFFFIFLFQLFITLSIVRVLMLLPKLVVEMLPFGNETGRGDGALIGMIIVMISMIILFPPFLSSIIKDRKRKGETDLRITYIISSKISKIGLKLIKLTPAISTTLLVISLIFALYRDGFHLRIFIAFVISLLLLLLISRPYQKLLDRVMKEALYYVEWKTHQMVDHFDERYSGYEIWRIPSSEMDFEQFNTYYFRNICLTTFVSVSVGCLSCLVYLLSLSPLVVPIHNKVEAKQVEQSEQLYEEASSNEKNTPQTNIQSNVASDESEEEIEGDVTQDDWEELMKMEEKMEDEAEVIADETIVKEEIIGKEKEETAEGNNSQIEYFPLSLLDEMPTMSDGTAFKRGIVSYLKKEIPELEGKYAYVEFKISPEGKVVEVDASLVNDSQLQDKIRKSLLSIPNVNPGKKGGHAVYVKTNITVER